MCECNTDDKYEVWALYASDMMSNRWHILVIAIEISLIDFSNMAEVILTEDHQILNIKDNVTSCSLSLNGVIRVEDASICS